MEPIIKWAGGKRRFAERIIELTGHTFNNYYEPFLGGGALLLKIKAMSYFCSDINIELINFYNVLKLKPKELYKCLENRFVRQHSKEFYYRIRNLDREKGFNKVNKVFRAARFYYLNKNCFNGLWRVNSNGFNNVPFANRKVFSLPDYSVFEIISNYFSDNSISFSCCSYEKCAENAKSGDFVYFDPPYDIEDGQNSFTSYTNQGFNRNDQIKLKKLSDELIKRGVKVAISNSSTSFIKKLYSDSDYNFYKIYDTMSIKRNIAASSKDRKRVSELLIIGSKHE